MAQRKRMRIGIDMDGIQSNFHGKWLPEIERRFGERFTLADLTHYEMRKLSKHGDKVDEIIHEPHFYRDLEPFPGALEAIRYLHDKGHDIAIVTSPGNNFHCIPDKADWLDEHLPFLNRRRRIFTSAKDWTGPDVFIDDSPQMIEGMAEANPHTQILTIAYPYNASVANLCALRAESCFDFRAAWKQLVEFIDAYADRIENGRAAVRTA